MTDETIARLGTALLAAIPPTLVALAGLLQGRANHTQVQQQTDEIEVRTKKTATDLAVQVDARATILENRTSALINKTDEIHDLTNSNLTLVKAQLAAALKRINDLEIALKLYVENHPSDPHVHS